MALQEELKQQGDFLFKFRSYLPLLLLVIGVWVKIDQEYYSKGNESIIAGLLESGSIIVGLLGLFIRVFTVGYTPKNTSGRNTSEGQVADTLNTTGIYSLVRNPLYVGNYMMSLAIAMLTGNIWFVLVFSLTFWIYYERIVYGEEHFLRRKFGEQYLMWTAKTPAFLPTHLKYGKSATPFSWKKALKAEKNGFLALFLLFLVFELIGKFVETGTFEIEKYWMVVGVAVAGVNYCVVKFLEKYTAVLDEKET